MHEPVPRPPLGIRPRWAMDEVRAREITDAMVRYVEAGRAIPGDWVLELREITHRLLARERPR